MQVSFANRRPNVRWWQFGSVLFLGGVFLIARELVEKVRVLSPATRLICSTGCTRSLTIERHINFLTKPFTAQQLLHKARAVLAVPAA